MINFFLIDTWDDKEFTLPKLKGSDVEKHFYQISQEYVQPYLDLSQKFTSKRTKWPKMPISWREDVSGWIRYNEDGSTSTVDAPLEDCFSFDVEVCVLEGHHPVIATALSKEAWYSWISPHLLNKTEPTRNCLIPSDLIKGNSFHLIKHLNTVYIKVKFSGPSCIDS